MSETQTADCIRTVVCSVLENAAFIFTDTIDGQDLPAVPGWNARGVMLTFTGEKNGTCALWAEESFARSAAANMLGIDEDAPDADAQAEDALKEVLNMILGNFLTTMYGDAPVFDLGLPTVLPPERLEQQLNGAGTSVWVEAEGTPLLIHAEVDR